MSSLPLNIQENPSGRTPESPPLQEVPWYIAQNAHKATLRIYEKEIHLSEHNVKIHKKTPPKRQKNDIQVFSRKSRIRLMRIMHQLQTAKLRNPIFVTLTARHFRIPGEEFRDKFLQKFLRKLPGIFGEISYIWRLEPHKSGYPHLHMIIWAHGHDKVLFKEAPVERMKKIWWDLIGDDSPAAKQHSCKVQRVNGDRHVMSYVSKYCAKEDAADCLVITGRRWGRSNNFEDCPITVLELEPQQALHVKLRMHQFLKKLGGWNLRSSEFVMDNSSWWVWLDTSQIAEFLHFASIAEGVHDLERYMNYDMKLKKRPKTILYSKALGISPDTEAVRVRPN